MLERLFSKNPVDFSIVRCVSIFDPRWLHSCLLDDSRQKLQRLLNNLVHLQTINYSGADETLTEITMFYQNIVKLKRGDFVSFEQKKVHLDDFYFKEVEVGKYKNLP